MAQKSERDYAPIGEGRKDGRLQNPNGIPSISPGLDRNAGLPWENHSTT
jgi:hypothetical protein